MGLLKLHPPEQAPKSVAIELVRSKSISNRMLILRALSESWFPITNLSSAKDTVQLQSALEQSQLPTINTGEGGTSYRFMAAYLASKGYEGVFTASGKMLDRPIRSLVDALNQLGAGIQYLQKEGYPPLAYHGHQLKGAHVSLRGDISSQFITALMMIAPTLSEGLRIQLTTPLTSKPYILLTASLMKQLGVQVTIRDTVIDIPFGKYRWDESKVFQIESDWSGASYFWAHLCLLPTEEMLLTGLTRESEQGDAIWVEWARHQGFLVRFTEEGLHLRKQKNMNYGWTNHLNLNGQPDLAQTLIALYANLNLPLQLEGLKTLFIKETDRLMALQKELNRLGHRLHYTRKGTATLVPRSSKAKSFQLKTYSDHRMAMSLSSFAHSYPISIENPEVVEKSFPSFWKELGKLGYRMAIHP